MEANGKLAFLKRFHDLLQKSVSHYTPEPENAERLMLKYYEYLLKIKRYVKNNFNLDVLENIKDFPIHNDTLLYYEYYKVIAEQIESSANTPTSHLRERYYIQKVKPFFIDGNIYYEITYSIAKDNVSKFDRGIAFTKLDFMTNYAVRLGFTESNVNIMGKSMPIVIIRQWDVSIRPCEFNNFLRIFNLNETINGTKEYYNLLNLLTHTGYNLIELIDQPDISYSAFRREITKDAKATPICNVLDKCRTMSKSNSEGVNVIRYLLYRLNNKIIKKQYSQDQCWRLSDLNLAFGCIPFDEMPYCTSLIGHNPKSSDLYACIDKTDREHEILARLVKNNTEIHGVLYTPIREMSDDEPTVLTDIAQYNERLYKTHKGHRQLEILNKHLYISGYENDTAEIIKKLQEKTNNGISRYQLAVDSWLQTTAYTIDCPEKKKAVLNMYKDSRVALIYGAAGTGKSTLINHISNFWGDKDKLYLANTNPAINNLKRKVNTANCTFKTISKYIGERSWYGVNSCDVLIIDECSTVSNADMLKVLNVTDAKLILLVGDIYQIESIIFGNWFAVAKEIMPALSITELTTPYRSTNDNLITLWNKVRNETDDILEYLTKNSYTTTFDETIFQHSSDDEIILCLNYDGLYGINNVNKFLQTSNSNVPVLCGVQIFKKGDPILFNDSNRFTPVLYNNLKGHIVDIEKMEDYVQFDVEIDKVINELDIDDLDLELIDSEDPTKSVVRICVYDTDPENDDDDLDPSAVVPFQIAYAISIHKAQGLEYKSVKIVITAEIDEMVTLNILYTAITRAREDLKIYWSPETENKVLQGLKKRSNHRDINFLRSKYSL